MWKIRYTFNKLKGKFFNPLTKKNFQNNTCIFFFSSAKLYQITVSIQDCYYCGADGSQYVKFTGTQGGTTEQKCEANFNLYGQDVTCTINSGENIGEYRCLKWRNGVYDGWDFTKVINVAMTLERHSSSSLLLH